MISAPEKIQNQIIELIQNSKNRLTPLNLGKQLLHANPDLTKKSLTASIKDLISNGNLTYTYEFGSSFLETSFDKPVRVSQHVVIKPERTSFSSTKETIVISLQKGASFGSGRHPSTRLALRAMERTLLQNDTIINYKDRTALDIGTGSGILAIASVKMGIGKAIGLDTDPCARSEAIQNIHLNRLAKKVHIDHRSFESIQEKFFLILANLRFPTLSDFHTRISTILKKDGFSVFSGLKMEEVGPIEKIYSKAKMTKRTTFTEKGWASIVFQKKD